MACPPQAQNIENAPAFVDAYSLGGAASALCSEPLFKGADLSLVSAEAPPPRQIVWYCSIETHGNPAWECNFAWVVKQGFI